MNRADDQLSGGVACLATACVFLTGFAVLAVRLHEVQIDDSADYSYASSRQSVRRVQTNGTRGRVFDRNGELIAGNRVSFSIVCDCSRYQRTTWKDTAAAVEKAVDSLAAYIGLKSSLGEGTVLKHVTRSPAMPLVVWRDVDYPALAKFSESEDDFPGFSCVETKERTYPCGAVAAHLIGYVGRDRGVSEAGDEKFDFFMPELRGRAGVEIYYDSFLRGVSGEKRILVDARGFAMREWTVTEAKSGPDLTLTIDLPVQKAAEHALSGQKGACVVLDPRNGDVLAMASAPGFDPNEFVPVLGSGLYRRMSDDPAKPLLNRASGGLYAPGSTFKPVTALAALSLGVPEDFEYECFGVYEIGGMKIRCASLWGHGPISMKRALMKSCNPYFCHLGVDVGTNSLCAAARAFGLGSKTGIDFGIDVAGVVPDGEWKMRSYGQKWYPGDVAQMSIGQGMLLVSPLQMARVAGAIGTGRLVVPHIQLGLSPETSPLPFRREDLETVREGMRMVVNGDGVSHGTGRRAGEGVATVVCGKTGTAEIGRGEMRRKNAWFIAYAPAENPTIALALVVENGEGGGVTAAPLAAEVLKTVFGSTVTEGEVVE